MSKPYEMQAGRELDALIHQRIFGIYVPTQAEMRAEAETYWATKSPQCQVFDRFKVVPRGSEAAKRPFSHELAAFETNCPEYSTDITAAWRVVEKVRQLKPDVRVESYQGYWHCHIDCNNAVAARVVSAEADTAPLAICRAALGMEVER